MHDSPINAAATLPGGDYAVAVSGGADSVALLALLRDRDDLRLTVVHLDHQTRAGDSTRDAEFVQWLATSWQLPSVIERRGAIEPRLADRPGNASALFRACRLALFDQVVRERGLAGAVLAHHADDQAETILHRLIRGGSPAGLAGMSAVSEVAGVMLYRPLLNVRRAALRQVLIDRGLTHREDASNTSDDYLRNRLRKVLNGRPAITPALLELGSACAAMRDWVQEASPVLGDTFKIADLADLPTPLARESARQWLIARGCPPDELPATVLDRLLDMARDAAAPGRQDFPAAVQVRRRRGLITALAIGHSASSAAAPRSDVTDCQRSPTMW